MIDGSRRLMLSLMLGAVCLVLLIACANVANLMLARSAARQKEIAIRTAMGAGRWRIVRQLLTESVMLSSLGAGLGLLLAWWGVDVLVALNPVELPSYARIQIDQRVLLFTLGVGLAVGLGFGLAPALQASRPDLNETLKEGGRAASGGAGRSRLRSLLVVSEVTLALVLLVGAGLLVKSFQRLQRFDPGFRHENVLTAQVTLPAVRYDSDEAVAGFARRLVERVEALPAVESASVASDIPLSNNSSAFMAGLEPGAGGAAEELSVRAYRHSVAPKFFSTLGVPLLRGRDFTPQDRAGSAPVVIVSESMARRYWPGGDALGRRLRLGSSTEDTWAEIVGVVGEVKHRSLVELTRPDPDVYSPLEQQPENALGLVVRARADAAGLAELVRREARDLDPSLPVYDVKPLSERVASQTAGQRFSAALLLVFASVALLLAAAGLYGVMSYTVAQRTREIGIRMALGAQGRDVLRLVVGQGMRPALAGVGLGLAAAAGLTRVMSSLLFGVSATDPATFACVTGLLVSVAFVSCYFPARRATRVDPTVALRYE